KELKEGKSGEALKAHEVLSHVTELLEVGENLTSIRRLKPRLPPTPSMTDETVVGVVRDTQRSYSFDPRAWKLLGIDIEAVVSGEPAPEKKAAKKRVAKKKTKSRKKA